ncbi:MAG: hypothetical protein ABIP09_07695 [Gemmatimonadaceae bacterium]
MTIRHVRTYDEFLACVELQAITWGTEFRETVPATILKVSQRLGGVTVGAFAEDGTLLGFVFGMTGVEHGAIVHWSDMLAVREGMQNHGLGRRLKEFQRNEVRSVGATRIYWTYDPLVARNAHFNLNRLGVRVVEYVPDMYGTNTGSALHNGVGTDRFIVDWPVAPSEATRPDVRLAAEPSVQGLNAAPILNATTPDGSDLEVSRFSALLPPIVRVEIPADIFSVLAQSAERAAHWRATTRLAFQWALASGYKIQRFQHEASSGRGFYSLTRS